jgi:hypothetical protein
MLVIDVHRLVRKGCFLKFIDEGLTQEASENHGRKRTPNE